MEAMTLQTKKAATTRVSTSTDCRVGYIGFLSRQITPLPCRVNTSLPWEVGTSLTHGEPR
jgi:hypothetical protein